MIVHPREDQAVKIRTAQVLAAFSLATDLAIGRPMQHVVRACYIGMHIARRLALSDQEQADLYYTLLLMHSGCTSDSSAMAGLIQGDELTAKADTALRNMNNLADSIEWMSRNVAPGAFPLARLQRILALLSQGPGAFIEGQRGYCEVGARVAQRLGMPDTVQSALHNMYEQWNGKGPFGASQNEIPLLSRVVQSAFVVEPFARLRGPAAALQEARERRGKSLDPAVVDAFLALDQVPGFWDGLQRAELWSAVLELEPDSSLRFIGQDRLDDVILAFADLTDLKSPADFGHSRGTARLAEGIAREMALSASETADIRRAALLHDLGNVAVPNTILDKQGPLTDAERARANLHPYYSEQVLTRVPGLENIGRIAGAHHERLDGQGYFRGLAGSQIPPGARVLRLADEYQSASQTGPAGARLEPEQVLAQLKPEVGPHLDPDCFHALARQLGAEGATPRMRRQWPAGLTDREVQVLRLLARGASNRQIAQELVITPKTAEHHVEHIYNKLGVSSRAGAIFFAVENELAG